MFIDEHVSGFSYDSCLCKTVTFTMMDFTCQSNSMHVLPKDTVLCVCAWFSIKSSSSLGYKLCLTWLVFQILHNKYSAICMKIWREKWWWNEIRNGRMMIYIVSLPFLNSCQRKKKHSGIKTHQKISLKKSVYTQQKKVNKLFKTSLKIYNNRIIQKQMRNEQMSIKMYKHRNKIN